MKLQDIIYESTAHYSDEAVEIVSESIIDYFGQTLTKLKGAHPEVVFSEQNPKRASLEEIAKMITALKVISKKEYRNAMTRDDIGINPNSARELFGFLNDVKKDGINDRHTIKVLDTLAHLAPFLYRKELEGLKDLKLDDDDKRNQAVQKLEAFVLRASQFFQKLKTSGSRPVTESTDVIDHSIAKDVAKAIGNKIKSFTKETYKNAKGETGALLYSFDDDISIEKSFEALKTLGYKVNNIKPHRDIENMSFITDSAIKKETNRLIMISFKGDHGSKIQMRVEIRN